jgi:hypothetical protein
MDSGYHLVGGANDPISSPSLSVGRALPLARWFPGSQGAVAGKQQME